MTEGPPVFREAVGDGVVADLMVLAAAVRRISKLCLGYGTRGLMA